MPSAFPSPYRSVLSVLAAMLLWAAPTQAQDQLRGDAPDDWLIQDATVLTVTNGTIENGDILVRDGDIARVGQDLSAPSGVETYDASGEYVMPGIVEAHQHMAISDVNEATNPVTAEVGVGDVLNPYDIGIYRALAGGVTTAHVMHGSANPIGGRNETIKLRYGVTNPDRLQMDGAPRTIKFALGENPTGLYGQGRDQVPRTRMGVEQVIRTALTKAERYMEAKQAYQDGERARPPAHSERMEVLAGVLRGDILVQTHGYRADEMLMLMDVFEDFGIQDLVFHHANEGFKIAPELAAFGDNGAGATVFSDWWSYKFEVYYSTAYNATVLAENGVNASINSDIPGEQRDLYLQAAKTQRYGDLSDTQALRLITINPARQLGIADRVGSIEEGKAADLALFSGHPLSVYTEPQRTYVDGVVRFDHEEDPDDMRLRVDPEGTVNLARDGWSRHAAHSCLKGVAQLRATRNGVSLENTGR
ncbi:imidazolonepropionase-like amidohydrolase [Salinibacter ruber]|uniref:amidohydrolase family protein n=1 Tax=Salinibacter ruber TaxID=146919 RepID=UPI002168F2D1|nr:amidohydrolase family protein [Salinibacter ruber]MCS3701052.1 imidazolonepropionase-like amidohydrolase [Salinibacter ruber]